jgi:Domain of unknown function (DUF4157)/Novel toxin 16
MRTFAQKTSSTQKPTSDKSMLPGRTRFEQHGRVTSILHSPLTIEIRPVEPSQQSKAENPQGGSAGTTPTSFGHDFARIPVHVGGHGNAMELDAGAPDALQLRIGHTLAAPPRVQPKCARCESEEQELPLVQPRLKVGPIDDRYEREADAIAHRVMAMKASPVACAPGYAGFVSVDQSTPRRIVEPAMDRGYARCQCEADEHNVRAWRHAHDPGVEAPASISELTSGGNPLPQATREFYEERMGQNFSGVRLHHGDLANQLNAAIGARAFTYRNHIWLGPNEARSPSVTLAHELSHVMQQTSPGRWGPTGVSAAPASIQRQLAPPGNCIQGIHDELQRAVKAWCDHPSGRACTGDESCHRLVQKIRRNQLCAQHRRRINEECYDGGDLGHRIAERDARNAQANCMALYRAKCEQPDEKEQKQVEQGAKPEKKSEEKKQPQKVQLQIVDGHAAFSDLAQRMVLEGAPDRDWIVAFDASYFDDRIKQFQNEQMESKLRLMRVDPRSVPFLQLSAPFVALAPFALAIEAVVVIAGVVAAAIFLAPVLAASGTVAAGATAAAESATVAGATGITATTSTGVTLTLIEGSGAAATSTAGGTGAVATIAKGSVAAAAIVTILLGGSKQASAAEIDRANQIARPLLDKPIFSLIAVSGKLPAVGSTISAKGNSFKVALRYTSR